MAKVQNDVMDKVIALCKGRGFIFQGSEIYGGLANAWDYGPLGVEFKNNVKRAWWKKFVQECRYNVGLDCAILMNRQVWVASGHVGNFNDPLMDCKACKARFRADKLIEDWGKEHGEEMCYILPSSTEEVIIVPGSFGENFAPEALAEMVSDVNHEQVAPQLQLDPTCYRFTTASGKIEIAATFAE